MAVQFHNDVDFLRFIEEHNIQLFGSSLQIQSDKWYACPSMFRLVYSGTGTITIQAKNLAGVVSTIDTFTFTGATNLINSYIGTDSVQLKITLSSSAVSAIILE